jgi:hypothetical protein
MRQQEDFLPEQALAEFFEGQRSARELGAALRAAQLVPEGAGFRSTSHYRVEPLTHPFTLQPEHLVRLVEALRAEELSIDEVGIACFLIEASDWWLFDSGTVPGDRIADVLFWLGTPQINYPLNATVLDKIARYLRSGVNTFDDRDAQGAGRAAP